MRLLGGWEQSGEIRHSYLGKVSGKSAPLCQGCSRIRYFWKIMTLIKCLIGNIREYPYDDDLVIWSARGERPEYVRTISRAHASSF